MYNRCGFNYGEQNMYKKLLIASLLALSTASLTAEEANAEHQAKHWGYEGDVGPEHWGELSDKFSLCATGTNQSPIDIKSNFDVELPAIDFAYKGQASKILNNGHTIQIDIENGSTISVEGKTFELKQFHFHSPSENTINGKSFPLEAHFVHRNKEENTYAVVAVMFEEGEENPILKSLWEKMPAEERSEEALPEGIDYSALMPEDKDYYRFNGSFTTPPCTEGVRWYVLKKPMTASKEQIEKFASVMKHPNNRNVQNIGARIIVE